MTRTPLGDLLRQAPDDLDPVSAERILDRALLEGAWRRRARRLAAVGAGLSTAAVVTVAVAAGGLTGPGGADSPEVAATTTPPSPTSTPSAAETSYAPGSETEVPGGPVIPTERRIADDAALLDTLRGLLPDGELEDPVVSRTESRVSGHMADRTRDGRRVSFSFDGASVQVTLQRWDGYAAVGLADLGAVVSRDPAMVASLAAGDEPERRAATTAREACAGAYSVYPPMTCTQDAEGWHRVDRPSQGAAMPDTYQELFVTLYTDDGYVVTVDSYNTPAEKAGPPVADEPVLTVAESLAMVRSGLWFVRE